MTFNIPKVQNLIQAIKRSKISTPITVGGYPFNLDKNLWKKIGADAYSSDFEEVCSMSENLCNVDNNEVI
jgi:MerR family transcriptional regulator, light-induced transcriptional regulator